MALMFDLTLSDGSQLVGGYDKTFFDPDDVGRTYPGPGAPPPAPPQDDEICTYLIQGDIEEPTVLKDTPAACDYLIDRVDVRELTIEPGVVIRAVQKGSFEITKGEGIYKGKLTAIGTPDKRIVFEGAEPLKGYWQGLELRDAQESKLHYVDVRDTGYDCRYCNVAGLTIKNTPVSLQYSSLSNGNRTGLYMDDEGSFLSFRENRFADHTKAGIRLASAEALTELDGESDYAGEQPNGLPHVQSFDGELTEDKVRRWKRLNAPYAFDYSVDLQAGSLSLDPGVDIIVSDLEFKVGSDARLSAQGTAAAPITFSGEKDENNDWEGVYFLGSVNNTLEHVAIRNAEWGVYLEDEAALKIGNSFIEADYGIFCDTGYSEDDKNKLELGPNMRFEIREFDIDPNCVLTP